MTRRFLFFILLFATPLISVQAQNVKTQDTLSYRNVYNTAAEYYEIGRLEQSQDLLLQNIKYFKDEIRESVYRLLALCSLELDQQDNAERYTREMLMINPYYTKTLNDPQRFSDLVDQISSGMSATITTASSQAENLSEVPVPTTLITERMIRDCGGRNLQEVLAAYVPGMNIVDCNDDINIAMRGVFNKGQEKILIMLNGHRLNSYCTNISSPDFSISLDKVKQIEVLRGPASSLYGGVALTAVVNIITKQGGDVNGVDLKYSWGNHGQSKYDVLIGKRYFDIDILIWGSQYKSKGESYFVPKEQTGLGLYDGNVTIGHVGDRPSWDAGVVFRFKPNKYDRADWKLMYNTHFSQITSPFTASFAFAPYNPNAYRTYNGLKPGYSTQSHHLEVERNNTHGRFSMNERITYDVGDLTHYQVISDSAVSHASTFIGMPVELDPYFESSDGISRYINGQESTYGIQLKGDFNYANSKNNKGLVSLGMQYSRFHLNDVRYIVGFDFGRSPSEPDTIPVIGKGSESSYNWFVQLKHHWKSFIINAGVRYDYKTRFDKTKVNELSPRVAFIYLQPRWNARLSYSKSFVDAPYLYRKTNLFLYQYSSLLGDTKTVTNLEPESMHSIQLSLASTNMVRGLNVELNGYYNRASKLIYTSVLENANTGNMKTYGLELMGSYTSKDFTANVSMETHEVAEALIYDIDFKDVFNIPTFSLNAVASWQVIDYLHLYGHLCFTGKQTAYSIDLSKVAGAQSDYRNIISLSTVDPRILFDWGVRLDSKSFYVNLNFHNFFNHKYYQSGLGTGLIRQQTRWWMLGLGIKL